MFVPVASVTDGGHRDCPVLASVAQWPEIQPLVSRGQIVSGVFPLLTDGQTDTQTDNYNSNTANSLTPRLSQFCNIEKLGMYLCMDEASIYQP